MAKQDLPIHPNVAPQVMTEPSGLRVRQDTAYTNEKGEPSKSARKFAEKQLPKLSDPLQRMLEPDEAVLYVCRANAPMGGVEMALQNAWSYYQTLGALVITNKRAIHLLLNYKNNWRRSMRSMRWGDVESATAKGFLGGKTVEFKFRNGKKETLQRLGNADGKKLNVLLPALVQASSGDVSPQGEMASVCPECLKPLTPKVYRCGTCGLVFKDTSTMLKRTLLIPGGGYLYTGQWPLAIIGGLVELFLFVVLLAWILIGAGVVTPQDPNTSRADAPGIIIGVLVIIALEKAVQYYHCRRPILAFSPTDRKEAPQVMTAGMGMK